MKDKTVYIFWTGGWDSTFRMIQLSQMDIVVQPLYISTEYLCDKRENELTAMEKILEKIKLLKDFKAKINPTLFYKRKDIVTQYFEQDVEDAYQLYHEKYKLGNQYTWFAMLAHHLNIKAELGIEKIIEGKIDKTFKEGKLIDIGENRLMFDLKKSPKELVSLFDYAIFPIYHYSKLDIRSVCEQNGWMDIMELTWFCHKPIKGKPCGNCNPCRDAMKEGMGYRLPFEAKLRYYWHNTKAGMFLQKIFSPLLTFLKNKQK
jgi:7-cyano-7-deazaguanine synthase